MLNEPTLDKLKELRLGAFAEAWLAQQADPESASLGFDERLGLLVDAEWSARHNKRLARNPLCQGSCRLLLKPRAIEKQPSSS